jgi:CheY-like chemotaxis protein
MKVLIVDDDVEDVELLLEALVQVDENIECISARNGEEALSLLMADTGVRPNYIFSDLNMPQLDGKQFLITLKNRSLLSNIPVIILTTSNCTKEKEEIIRLGAAHFITKPSKFGDLISVISNVLLEDQKDRKS